MNVKEIYTMDLRAQIQNGLDREGLIMKLNVVMMQIASILNILYRTTDN